MLQVKQVPRETIDAWPVAESGLPVRVVNSVSAVGVKTIGELRKWSDSDLLGLRSLGRISIRHVRAFFKLCTQIEQGRQTFQNVQQVFSIFLDGPELKVLSHRYGFARQELDPRRNWATLQEIGDMEGKTRERVRQVEAIALGKLNSRLAQVCLQPFHDLFAEFIDNHGRTIVCSRLVELKDDQILAGYNVCAIVLLLCDVSAGKLTFHHKFFTTLSKTRIRDIEARLIGRLEREENAVSLEELLTEMPEEIDGLEQDSDRRKTVACVMDHSPAVAATVDGRYFLFSKGTHSFVAEVLKTIPRPAHYRAITNAFNERVKPPSRKGAGYILDSLNSNPKCVRVDRGIYDLKQG